MRVEVTAKDIDEGVPRACFGCPVALALTRASKKLVLVSAKMYSLDGIQAELPEDVINWVTDFDLGQPVQPITFEVPT